MGRNTGKHIRGTHRAKPWEQLVFDYDLGDSLSNLDVSSGSNRSGLTKVMVGLRDQVSQESERQGCNKLLHEDVQGITTIARSPITMIDRIAHAVLNAIAPTVHATIQKELASPAKKSPGRPRKHKAEETGAVPEPNSQAGMILALLSKGTRSGTELADGSGLSTRQVHSNLQSLRKRHLVVTKGRGQYALANGVSP